MTLIGISHTSGSARESYVLHALIAEWRARGIGVEIGSGFPPTADLCILHHDCTRLNPTDIPNAPDSVRVLNRDVLDISKRLYSELMLTDGDDWDGPVIVKTNLNSFGGPERRRAVRNPLHEAQKLLARYNWKLARTLSKGVYPVLASLSDVPSWVWEREDLLVERFMPEREGDLFALRGWLFLGSAGYGYRMFATDPMVKTGSMVKYEYLDEVPPELEVARQRMGFDFGKFDYVVHDGRAILLDANKTPSFAGDPKSERLKGLADAVMEFLP
jgi:hypothetical protein